MTPIELVHQTDVAQQTQVPVRELRAMVKAGTIQTAYLGGGDLWFTPDTLTYLTTRRKAPSGSKNDELLTSQEVARLFRVDPRTVTRWAKTGRISCIRTLGGHRRYRSSEIKTIYHQE